MGLLDDAIREHLDLKRRSGGDPSEIERLEREALGPVRRDPTGAAPTATAYEEPPTEYLQAHREESPSEEVPRAEIVSSAPEAPPKRRGFLHRRQAPPPEPESAAEPAAAPVDHDDESEPPRLALAGEHDEPPDPSDEPVSPLDQPTVEHRVLDDPDYPEDDPLDAGDGPDADDEREAEDRAAETGVKPDDPEQDKDDVLEETPEFLQDTPEHDRLWFEQRPPKDFDFDG